MDEPALLVLWERVVGELLDRTAAFPKAARFTFAARLDGRALDVLECLAEARFAPPALRSARLADADRHLAVLRVLLRVSHDRRYLSTGQLAHLSRLLDEAGRMLGGWRVWLEEHAR
jgi:hypothetical protein